MCKVVMLTNANKLTKDEFDSLLPFVPHEKQNRIM